MHCGFTHSHGSTCNKKNPKTETKSWARSFRNTIKWQKVRNKVKERDKFLCQICIRNLYNTMKIYNYEDLEVHHNIPVSMQSEHNLDVNNLITVCHYHHKLCDKGEIPTDEVDQIIREQNINLCKLPMKLSFI